MRSQSTTGPLDESQPGSSGLTTLPALLLNRASDSDSHIAWALGDFDPRVLQRGDLFGSRPFAARDACARVAHAPARRRGAADDERRDRFRDVGFNKGGRFVFRRAADCRFDTSIMLSETGLGAPEPASK